MESFKGLLFSEEFKVQCRIKEKHFIRKRRLTFTVMVGFLLNLLTKTLQIELERFFKVLKGGEEEVRVSKQAFSKARKKLSEQAFIRLNEKLVEEFYTDNTYQTWKGYRLLGVDGSTVQLPMSEEILEEFDGVGNQYGTAMAMGKVSVLYDVLNDLSADAILDRYTTEERELALRHVEALAKFDERTEGRRGYKKDLLLFDMGYPALYFMVMLILRGKDFVIRTSGAFLKEVNEAVQSDQDDVVIQIPIAKPGRPMPEQLKELMPQIDPNWRIVVRVVKIRLEDGTQEILLTTLLDTGEFPYEDFRGLYAKRWGSETNYDVLKNILEIENFTGKSALSVRQDFYATVLTNNIRGLIQWELKEEIEAENQSQARKYTYQLNRNLSIGRLKDTLVTLILEQGDLQGFYSRLKQQMKRNLVPIRPGRRFARKRKNRQKYSMNKRRAL